MEPHDTRLCLREISVYMDRACINNRKDNAKCSGRIWFRPNHAINKALHIPGRAQSNQIGELGAVIAAIDAVPTNQPMKIITDLQYVIKGLTDNLHKWKVRGWIGIQNTAFFKRAAFLMRRCTAQTSFHDTGLCLSGLSGSKGSVSSGEPAPISTGCLRAESADGCSCH